MSEVPGIPLGLLGKNLIADPDLTPALTLIDSWADVSFILEHIMNNWIGYTFIQ
jgi:hypothetical protein